MNEHNPLISIIIPVYNTEKYLIECLESVVNQKFKNIEIIIVNDCSLGNCDEILYEYKNKFENLKLIKHNYNMGLFQTRLTGIKNSSGKYIMHLDSDDFLCNNILYHIYNLVKRKDYDIIFYDVILTDGKIEIPFDDWFKIPLYPLCKNECIIEYFINGLNHTMWAKVYRRDLILKCLSEFPNIENITSYEDLLQNIIIAKFANNSYSIHKIGYCYRKNINSNTQKKKTDYSSKNKLLKEVTKVINILHNFFIKYNFYEKYAIEISLLYKSIIRNYCNLSNKNNYYSADKYTIEHINIISEEIKNYIIYYANNNYIKYIKKQFKLFYIGIYSRIIIIYLLGIKISFKRNKKYSYILNRKGDAI